MLKVDRRSTNALRLGYTGRVVMPSGRDVDALPRYNAHDIVTSGCDVVDAVDSFVRARWALKVNLVCRVVMLTA